MQNNCKSRFGHLSAPQSDHRVHPHSSPCRDITSQQRDEHHEKRRAPKSEWIGWRDAVEFAGEQPGDHERRTQAEGDAGDRKLSTFFENQPKDVTWKSAKRNTNTDFASTCGDEERQNAIDADGAENKRESGKGHKQGSCRSGSRNRLRDDLVHWFNFAHWNISTQTSDRAPKRILQSGLV